MIKINDNTRTEAIDTSPYPSSILYVIEGNFGGGTATLQWSETNGAGARWSTVKGPNDADVAVTENTNGTVAVGDVGFLSVLVEGATAPSLYVSLLSR